MIIIQEKKIKNSSHIDTRGLNGVCPTMPTFTYERGSTLYTIENFNEVEQDTIGFPKSPIFLHSLYPYPEP